MGRMKKLWALAEQLEYPFPGEDLNRHSVDVAIGLRDMADACKDALDRIRKAEFLIGDWLTNQYEHVFGVQDDLETARQCLNEAINLLEGPSESANRASQPTADAG